MWSMASFVTYHTQDLRHFAIGQGTSSPQISQQKHLLLHYDVSLLDVADHPVIMALTSLVLLELIRFLEEQKAQGAISEFCSIEWKFIPEHAPHFGDLWEAAMKYHLKRVITDTKLTFEELTTVLTVP